MTIQVTIPSIATSKAALQQALNRAVDHADRTGEASGVCEFYDPSIFPGSRGTFSCLNMVEGESFPVVMDPAKRMRFALVKRMATGYFKVS